MVTEEIRSSIDMSINEEPVRKDRKCKEKRKEKRNKETYTFTKVPCHSIIYPPWFNDKPYDQYYDRSSIIIRINLKQTVNFELSQKEKNHLVYCPSAKESYIN
jgi:hypothetical protein